VEVARARGKKMRAGEKNARVKTQAERSSEKVAGSRRVQKSA